MKKFGIAVMILAIMVSFVGCGVSIEYKTEEQSTSSNETLKEVFGNTTTCVYTFVDEETGVNYIIYSGYYKGGITPRLNADGSLYISEVNRQ